MTVKGQYHEQDVYICLNNKHIKMNMQKLTVSSIVAELLIYIYILFTTRYIYIYIDIDIYIYRYIYI